MPHSNLCLTSFTVISKANSLLMAIALKIAAQQPRGGQNDSRVPQKPHSQGIFKI